MKASRLALRLIIAAALVIAALLFPLAILAADPAVQDSPRSEIIKVPYVWPEPNKLEEDRNYHLWDPRIKELFSGRELRGKSDLPILLAAADPPGAPQAAAPPGFAAPTADAKSNLPIQMAIITIAPLLVALVKQLTPSIPKPLLPILCVMFGPALATLAEYFQLAPGAGASSLMLGASGVALRELIDQARKKFSDGGGGGGDGISLNKPALAACMLAALITQPACASIKPLAEDYDPETGHLVRRTSLSVTAIGGSKAIVESLKATNGKTHSLGAKGVEEHSSGIAELVELIKLLRPSP